MNRRHFLGLLSTPVLVALLDACGSDDDATGDESAADDSISDDSTRTTEPEPTGPRDAPAPAELRSSAARAATTAGDADPAVDVVEQFGMALFRALAGKQPDGNLVVSPMSIAIALTMVSAGARGTTLDELVTALRISDPAIVHHAMNAL